MRSVRKRTLPLRKPPPNCRSTPLSRMTPPVCAPDHRAGGKSRGMASGEAGFTSPEAVRHWMTMCTRVPMRLNGCNARHDLDLGISGGHA